MRRNMESLSILLLQEGPETAFLLKDGLERQSSHRIHIDSVKNIRETLSRLSKKSYDLLLIESGIRSEKGLSLLKRLCHEELQLPFMLLTPVRDDKLAREAMKAGVAGVIIKSESHFRDLAEQLTSACQKCYGQTPKKSGISRSSWGAPMIEKTPSEGVKQPDSDLSIHDELTGLYNHSYLQNRIVREFSRAARYNHPLSCLLLDIDHFKNLNEEKGYWTGDAVLKEFASILFENCRISDLVARYGGGEFAALLPHIDYEGARELGKRLRLAFSEHIFQSGSEDIHLTVSVGIASFPEDAMDRRSDLISYAHQALLRSKALGRNRITLFRDISPVMGAEVPALKISEEKVAEFQRKLSEISEATRRTVIDASRALILTLEGKDPLTAGHAASCAKYAGQMARMLGMSTEDSEVVEHAALLHDIGKICIPDDILLKPGKLTFVEYENMKQHPFLGYRILKPIKFLREEAILVLHHHEWFNGDGYPSHLKGDEIPLGSRIISVIDSYDTMRIAGNRYKKTIDLVEAVNELIAYAGIQFDPKVVKAFVDLLKMRKELLTDGYHCELLEERIKIPFQNRLPAERIVPETL